MQKISDEMIDSIGILAKLELSSIEKEKAKKDMKQMLDYIEEMNQLDTTMVQPTSHVLKIHNVFREDVVENKNEHDEILTNAPEKKNGNFCVPKTMEVI